MAVVNNLRKQIDQPIWEWLRFFPAANSALSEMTFIETPDKRYMYLLVASAFWRYDTYSDLWQSLAAPVTAPLLILSLKYLPYGEYSGKVISATSTTITGAFLQGQKFVGEKLRITSGTGAGQERTITAHGDSVIADLGQPTTATALAITDTTKKWDINQWVGYTLKIVTGAGVTQRRKILYNTATVLTVSDPLWQQNSPLEAIPFSTAPTTASQYTIESNTLTVATWDTTPDTSSRFRILTGQIGCLSTTASAPFQTYQVYDIAHDIWITKSCQQGLLLAAGAVANDISFHRLDEGEAGSYLTGTATVTGSSTRSLGDTTKTWAIDQWANYELWITGGTGIGTRARILGNTDKILYVDGAIISPDATSTYKITSLSALNIASGWALSSVLGYNADADNWTQSFMSDYGMANILSVRLKGQQPISCTATRAVNGIKTILSTPTNGGTGYTVGDVLTCNQTGTGGLLIVTGTDNNGVVTGLKIQKCGTNYAVASGRTTTGGTGSGCTFEITALGTIGTITTSINHNFQKGDVLTFAGDALWAADYTVLGVSGLTVVDVETTAAGSATGATAQSATVIVDASKSWTVNEHVGKIVQLSLTGLTGTSQFRRITSNTATAITIYGSNITPAVEGTSRYVIYNADAFGRAVQEKNPARTNTGYATSGSGTTLVDSTKTWRGNQWLGYKVRIVSGLGYDKNGTLGGFIITSNTSNTLAVSGGYGFVPDSTTKYIIEDTFGIVTAITNTTNAVVTDSTKAWTTNQWTNFRIRITAGEGAGQEATITSNTATALTISGVFATVPVINSSTYTILGVPVRGTGHELTWASNSTRDAGRYIYSPKGGASNIWDRFDITKNTWDLTFVIGPDTETFALGTMYAYDGSDRIYIQKDSTGRCFYLDINTYKLEGAGTMPYIIGTAGIGTAVNGNRMEILKTSDGLKYLYVMKHTGAALSATGGGTEMFRQLILY
jgi:hypothetical protein